MATNTKYVQLKKKKSSLCIYKQFKFASSLIFDSEIKTQLLDYAVTAMLFADKKVDKNIISCNRFVPSRN